MDIYAKIDSVIGNVDRQVLQSASANLADFERAAELIFMNYDRDKSKPIIENLYLALIKSAVQSQKYNAAELTGKCQALIKLLSVSEADRQFFYECLFDQGGLSGHGLRLFQRYANQIGSMTQV